MSAIKFGPPKIGIFIMPDNYGLGMLENLCLKTIEDQKIKVCVDDYISCIADCQSVEEREHFNEAKARVQAYLAARVPLVNSLGLGAIKGYWDFEHSCFDEIKKFLHDLFGND